MIQFNYDIFLKEIDSRRKCLNQFLEDTRYVPILMHDVGKLYINCKSAEEALKTQLKSIENTINLPGEWIPYLEPWHGVSVYANAYGAEYEWPDEDSPWTVPIIANAKQAERLQKPSVTDSPIMKMVLNTIGYFREMTDDQIPICLTDTQSPIDNAILIWNPSDYFVSCYTCPDIVHEFMKGLTELTVEFSKLQIQAIGRECARPGHIMLSDTKWPGIALSDDMISVVSPRIYRDFGLKYNNIIGEVFESLSIHSCGRFYHNISELLDTTNLFMVDLALSQAVDPNPNQPEVIRDLFSNTGIIVKIRVGNDDDICSILEKLDDPGLHYCVDIAVAPDLARMKAVYETVDQWLRSRGRR